MQNYIILHPSFYRFTHMSPLKNRLPLAERKEITNTARHHELTKPCKPTECNSAPNNYVPAQPINPVYLHPSKYGLPPSGQCQDAPEQPPPPRPPLPVAHCQLIARQISTADTHEIWKHAALDQLVFSSAEGYSILIVFNVHLHQSY